MRSLNQKNKCQPYAWFRALASRTFQVKKINGSAIWKNERVKSEGKRGKYFGADFEFAICSEVAVTRLHPIVEVEALL